MNLRFLYSSVALVFLSCVSLAGQKFKVTIDGKYNGDTIIIGNFYGDKQLIQDTLFKKSGSWVWSVDSMPKTGVYFALLRPKNTYFQILVNGTDTNMSFTFDENNLESVTSKGSLDNKLFNDYVFFLKDRRVFADTLRAKIERNKAANLPVKEFEDSFTTLDNEVKTYQNNIIAQHPNTLCAVLIKSSQEIELPTFEGDEKEVQTKKYFYYKEHYFDNIPLENPAIIRTPFLHQKVDYFLTKLVSQEPDTLIKAVDKVLRIFEKNPDAYDFFLSNLLNTYGQFKMVGHDAIVVHLVDNYYLKGKSKWSTPESLEKLDKNVADYRPTLIGKTMPNFTTYMQDGTPVTLNQIKAKYTIMIAWDPDCGNCKKTMPYLVDFYNKHKDKDIKVLSICNKSGEKANTCWPFIKEKNMENFINTGDEYQRWNQVVRNNKVPKIYIMDQSKKILMKDMSGEDLEKIFMQIYDFDNKKNNG